MLWDTEHRTKKILFAVTLLVHIPMIIDLNIDLELVLLSIQYAKDSDFDLSLFYY
jgi:hypothetical protein